MVSFQENRKTKNHMSKKQWSDIFYKNVENNLKKKINKDMNVVRWLGHFVYIKNNTCVFALSFEMACHKHNS